jgi:hypothetical protein
MHVLLRSQQIQFGLMDPNEIVKASEFQVYERSLYKVRAAGRPSAAAGACHAGVCSLGA